MADPVAPPKLCTSSRTARPRESSTARSITPTSQSSTSERGRVRDIMSVIEGAVQIQGGEPWPPNEYQQKSLVCESSRRLRRLELLCPVVAQSLGQTERRHVADLGVSANEVFSPSHETKHLWQLWVRALGLAGQDGGIELACRLELLPLGEERCDVCRRFQSTSASARQVESEESHRLFELGE